MDDCMSMDAGTDTGADQDADLSIGDGGDSGSTESDAGLSSYDDTSWSEDSGSEEADDDTGGNHDVSATVEAADSTGCGGSDVTSDDASLPHADTLAAAPGASHPVAAPSTDLGGGGPLVALPGQVAAVPGTASGSGTPTSWDASGTPTHVSYSGVINPPTESVTMGGNNPFYTGPAPADPTHVTLDYVPQQVPRTDGLGPSPGTSNPQVLALRGLIAQTNTDMITNTVTGVSVDRSGTSPTYYGAGRPFDDFGDALGAERGR